MRTTGEEEVDPEPSLPLGAVLRQARQQRGISLGEMAKQLRRAKSTLSAVETGAVMPSAELLHGYERCLGLSSGTLREEWQLPAVTRWLEKATGPLAKKEDFSFEDFPELPGPKQRAVLMEKCKPEAHVVQEGYRQCLDMAIGLVERAQREPSKVDRVIQIAFQSAQDAFHRDPTLSQEWLEALRQEWLEALRRALTHGYNVVQISRLSDDARRRMTMTEEMLNLLGSPAGKFLPYYFSPQHSSPAVLHDLVIVPGQGALQMFGSYQAGYVDSAFYVGQETPEFPILRRYFENLRSNALPLLQTYPSRSDAFERAVLKAEGEEGDKLLVKDHLSTLLIPRGVDVERVRRILENHANAPAETLRQLEAELQQILENRRERQAIFEDRAERSSVRHVVAKPMIKQMITDGRCARDDRLGDVNRFGDAARFTKEEAISCIRQTIHYLTRYPNFEMALVEFRSPDDPVWEVIGGTQAAFVEAEDAEGNEVDLAIHEPAVVSALRDYFLQLWDGIDSQNKDRARMIRWLELQIGMH